MTSDPVESTDTVWTEPGEWIWAETKMSFDTYLLSVNIVQLYVMNWRRKNILLMLQLFLLNDDDDDDNDDKL